MSDVIILIKKGDTSEKPMLYACGKCGTVNSPKIYACREEDAHTAAFKAAETCYTCRKHNICDGCGKECPKGWLKCAECREEAKRAKATIVDDASLQECFGVDGNFYSSVEEAEEAGEPYVFGATFSPFRLNFENLIDNILDDHHEDASTHDLIGLAELRAAVNAFNAAQTSGSYFEDPSIIAYLKIPSQQKDASDA